MPYKRQERVTYTHTDDARPAGGGTDTFDVYDDFATPFTVTVRIKAPPEIALAPDSLPSGKVAQAYNQAITASGGSAPYRYRVSANTLPAGLSLSSGGVLSGTPSSGGAFPFSITANDAGSLTKSKSYTLAVAAPTLSLPSTNLPDATQGKAYSSSLPAASAGTMPYRYALSPGSSLPAGLSLNAQTGAISGTPRASGQVDFSITATDSSSGDGPYSVTQSYTITVAVAPPLARPVSVALDYNAPATNVPLEIDGTPDSVSVVTPPSSGTAQVSGLKISYTPKPGFAGADHFTYTASNRSGRSEPASVNLTVGIPAISLPAATLPDGTQDTAYAAAIPSAAGGTKPYRYALSPGSSLPAGLSLNAQTGAISGTPRTSSQVDFSITATDSSSGDGPYSATQSYTITVAVAPPLARPVSVALNYNAPATDVPLEIDGGTPDSVSVVTPPGNGTAQVSGLKISYTPKPGFAGTDRFTYTASNRSGRSEPASVNLTVGTPAISLPAATLPDGTQGTAYAATIPSAAGGTTPYRYTLSRGSRLHRGLGLNANTGAISGTPRASGRVDFSITATDSSSGDGPYSATQSYTIAVAPTPPAAKPVAAMSLPAATLPNGTQGAAYSANLPSASGGTAPYGYALSPGSSLPAGLSLNVQTGAISGTPDAGGRVDFSITATDRSSGDGPYSATQSYTITVVPAPTPPATQPAVVAPSITAGAPPLRATVGMPFSATFTFSGGTPPWQAHHVRGLPAGLTITSTTANTVTVSGTPTTIGRVTLAVSATDSRAAGAASTVARNFALNVQPAVITTEPAVLPDASQPSDAAGTSEAGAAYHQRLTASGGVAPYRFAVTQGALPDGLTLDEAGLLWGQARSSGRFDFTITVTDAYGSTAAPRYSIFVPALALALLPATLEPGLTGIAYRQSFGTQGGNAPYRYAVTAGALPEGLQLTDAGVLHGTPGAAGQFAFTVTATDKLGFTGERVYALNISSLPDPSQNPEVRGLIAAQTEAAARFMRAQISNFHARLETLHHDRNRVRFSHQLHLSGGVRLCRPDTKNPAELDCSPRPAAAETPTSEPDQADDQADWAAWAGGYMRLGHERGQDGEATSLIFQTDGVSAGMDRDFGKDLDLGIGVGWAQDHSEVGQRNSRSIGTAHAVALYGSYHPQGAWFTDVVLGYQSLYFDQLRRITASDGFANGRRSGHQLFGSLAVGVDVQLNKHVRLSPYARTDIARTDLAAYAESGDSAHTLHYGELRIRTSSANLGLLIQDRSSHGWGRITHQLRLEYQAERQSAEPTSIHYTKYPSQPYLYRNINRRRRMAVHLGSHLEWANGWALGLTYQGEFAKGQGDAHGFVLQLQKTF